MGLDYGQTYTTSGRVRNNPKAVKMTERPVKVIYGQKEHEFVSIVKAQEFSGVPMQTLIAYCKKNRSALFPADYKSIKGYVFLYNDPNIF